MRILQLHLAFKNLSKNKLFSSINIIGLSISLAVFVIILFYVEREESFDKFHADFEKIYRVESQFRLNGEITQDIATASFGYAPAMAAELPDVESVCRINIFNHEKDIQYKSIIDREEKVFMVDSNFFSFFTHELINGDKKTVLSRPNYIVLSEKAASKYFLDEDPLGKVMMVKDQGGVKEYEVTGIFKNLPSTANVKFDFLLAYDYNSNFLNNFWYMHETYLYVKVSSYEGVERVEQQFPEMVEKYKSHAALKAHRWEIELVPLADIHLNQAKPYELEEKGNSRSISFLKWMAILVIIIAWINYINLATIAIIQNRSSYAVMKVQGARNINLIGQVFFNSLVINLISLIVSIGLISLTAVILGNYINHFRIVDLFASQFILLTIVGVFISGTLITGLLPGYLILDFKGSINLRQSSRGLERFLLARKVLVIAQYASAAILIISALMIKKQLNFMGEQEIGAETANIIAFKTPTSTDSYFEKLDLLKIRLKEIAAVEGISMSSVVPGQQVSYMGSHKRADEKSSEDKLFEMLRVDPHFIPLYNLSIKEGRNFYQDAPDNNVVIVNEKAAEWFGYSSANEAVNQIVNLEGKGDTPYRIVGVIDNYHQQSLQYEHVPIMLFMTPGRYWIPLKYVSVKLASAPDQNTIRETRKIFKEIFPGAAFQSFIVNEHYNIQYLSDSRFSVFFIAISWLAIIIVCIGLFGLSGYIIALRTKEIGVRKVNGARNGELISMLNKNFIAWVALSLIIAMPIAWLAMDRWLQNFAFKTRLSWWIFALAALIIFLVAVITVSFQSFRAASRNPVEALRYE